MHGRDGSPAKFCEQLRCKPLPKRRFSYCMVIEDINFSDNSNWIMTNSLRGTHNLFAINPFRGSVNFQSADALVLPPKMAVWVLWLSLVSWPPTHKSTE